MVFAISSHVSTQRKPPSLLGWYGIFLRADTGDDMAKAMSYYITKMLPFIFLYRLLKDWLLFKFEFLCILSISLGHVIFGKITIVHLVLVQLGLDETNMPSVTRIVVKNDSLQRCSSIVLHCYLSNSYS